MPLCFTLSIIRYESRVSGAIPIKEKHLPLQLDVVAIEKGAFRLLLTTVGQLIHIYNVHSISFQTFFVRAVKIVVDS